MKCVKGVFLWHWSQSECIPTRCISVPHCYPPSHARGSSPLDNSTASLHCLCGRHLTAAHEVVSIFESWFYSQKCIFDKNSLSKGKCLFSSPQSRVYFWRLGAFTKGISGLKSLKIMQKWSYEIRKCSLAKGMFSTKFSLGKDIRSKSGAAHFSGVTEKILPMTVLMPPC